MKLIVKLSCILLLLGQHTVSAAQNNFTQTIQIPSGDVFVPIGKYIEQGDAEALSAWFDKNLEVSIMSRGGMASKVQATQIMSSFFNTHKPESFEVSHKAGRANMKYILARLKAGGELYSVVLFLNGRRGTYRIQQIKIDRIAY